MITIANILVVFAHSLCGSVENIPLTCHEDVTSHDLRRSILAELRIVSNLYTLQPLLTSAEISIR